MQVEKPSQDGGSRIASRRWLVHPRSGELAVRGVAARIAYAALFCAVLPVLLVLWARATADAVTLPAYGWPALAFLLAIAGGPLLPDVGGGSHGGPVEQRSLAGLSRAGTGLRVAGVGI